MAMKYPCMFMGSTIYFEKVPFRMRAEISPLMPPDSSNWNRKVLILAAWCGALQLVIGITWKKYRKRYDGVGI